MDSSRNLDDIQSALESTLAGIENELGKILDGTAEVMDPDSVLDGLDGRADELCRALESMNDSLEQLESNEGADLSGIAAASLANQMDAISFPVVVSSEFDSDIPTLSVPTLSTHSAVDKSTRLALEFAGHGGELRIRTCRADDLALFTVQAIHNDSTPVDASEYELRLGSVKDFVTALGGEFTIEAEADSLQFEMCLPVGVEVY